MAAQTIEPLLVRCRLPEPDNDAPLAKTWAVEMTHSDCKSPESHSQLPSAALAGARTPQMKSAREATAAGARPGAPGRMLKRRLDDETNVFLVSRAAPESAAGHVEPRLLRLGARRFRALVPSSRSLPAAWRAGLRWGEGRKCCVVLTAREAAFAPTHTRDSGS